MQNIALSGLFFLRKLRIIPKVEGLMMKLMRNFPAFSKHTVVVSIFDDVKMKLNLDDLVQQHLFAHGYYEPEATAMWKYCLQSSKIVADVGANVGYYSLLSAKYGKKDTQIFSFEPMTHIFNRAKENIYLNSFSNIHLTKVALSNEKKKEVIALEEENNWGGSNIVVAAGDGKIRAEQIETTTLDLFVQENNLERVDLIKMDVEGYEPFALHGMTQTIKRFEPIVFIEILEQLLSRFHYTPNDVFGFFHQRGYHGYMILPNQRLKKLNKAISFDGLILFAKENDKRVQAAIVAE
jgi:FkbM family methyltransferase